MVGCYKSEKCVPELVTPPAVPWMGCESKHREEGCLTPAIPDASRRPWGWGSLQPCPTKKGVETGEVGAGRQPVGGACVPP